MTSKPQTTQDLIHIWSVQRELRDPQSADAMRALRDALPSLIVKRATYPDLSALQAQQRNVFAAAPQMDRDIVEPAGLGNLFRLR